MGVRERARASLVVASVEPVAPPAKRYTPDGDDSVETRIERDQALIAQAAREAVPETRFVALVLMGGYGRGEGGYVRTASGPAPYNDYDYFVVVQGTSRAERAAIAARLAETARRLEPVVGVEVDFALLRQETLHRAEFSLMNAEMRWGHRVVAGDPTVLSVMPPMPFDRLPPGELTRLMTNRGALLLMDRQRLAAGGPGPGEREVFFKYLMKAMLACGDTRLATAGLYHPSYPVKLERLRSSDRNQPESSRFLELYRQAYEQKLRPDYSAFDSASPADSLAEILALWLDTLRSFETRRLGLGFGDWSDYCRPAIGKGQWGGPGGPLRNLAITARDFGPSEPLRSPARSLRYVRERLVAALPLLLTADPTGPVHPCVADALALPTRTPWGSAAESFLARWRRFS
jgi:hypothetical protein